MKSSICLIAMLTLLCFLACDKSNNPNIKLNERETILLDSDYNKWLEGEYGYKKWQPTQDDIDILKAIINKAIDNNKLEFIKKPIKKNIKRYYRQYIPYINLQNEKIIKINAFCEILDVPPSSSSGDNKFTKMDWKNQYVAVDDGGICYWEMTVNIDTQEYFK